MTHPITGLEEVVHQRVRLGILAILDEAKRVDFAFLRNSLELTDGNLARHLQVLEAAGYVGIQKTFEGRRPRTWVRATSAGGRAFHAEIASLQALLDRVTTQGEGSR